MYRTTQETKQFNEKFQKLYVEILKYKNMNKIRFKNDHESLSSTQYIIDILALFFFLLPITIIFTFTWMVPLTVKIFN